MELLLKKIEGIARRAAQIMLDAVASPVHAKEGHYNFVTDADVQVQNMLISELSALLPGAEFFAEEKENQRLTAADTFIIDPIDGTANYSRGIDQCAICVGLKHGNEMVMGVVYVPRTSELFHAEKGKGAYLNGKRIGVSGREFGNGVLCTALPVYHKEYAEVCSRIIVETFGKCNDIRRFGACAPELCYLAMGRCELYFEYLLSPWDYAAASLIVTEAGGVITSSDGSPLRLTEPTGVVAANNESNHSQMLGIVAGSR